LDDAAASLAVEHWRAALGVTHPVRLERIGYRQVTDERGAPGCSLVGVVTDDHGACIYHTRALTLEDIVHELLHVAHPTWTEEAVVSETNRLLTLDQRKIPAGSSGVGSAEPTPDRQQSAGHAV
jgi:hypothetical protein